MALKDYGVIDADVLVLTQKIVSKSERRFLRLSEVEPGAEAIELAGITGKDPRLVEAILRESSNVVRAVPGVLITRHRSGHVMANAGIDQSNLGRSDDDVVLLLPLDADASAQSLHSALGRLLPHVPAIVISDSFGRPWRYGVTQVAIGAHGFPALVDRRGQIDRDGRRLEVTQIALADLVASAAGLVMGEAAEGIPAALVRGLDLRAGPHCRAAAIVRPIEEDLFR